MNRNRKSGTRVRFGLAPALRGRELAVLADGWTGSGRHAVRWDGTASDGTKPGSGVTLVRLVTPSAGRVRKITLLR